ncbi:putative ubiquitinyl hydrolase 1 [Helianthus annuus]|nr:putative ubiquitinyl hydrolase 1 [Helianthus annuus]
MDAPVPEVRNESKPTRVEEVGQNVDESSSKLMSSGRCQIIHWRQGHKDECRPYVAVKDASSKQEDGKHSGSGRNERMLKVVDQPKTSKLPRHCSQKAESDTGTHKYSCKVSSNMEFKRFKITNQHLLIFLNQGLFSYEMFVKLYKWKQIELRPFGLINCGNSCYANAVLQCLKHTPPLNAYFLQGLHSKACELFLYVTPLLLF